MKGEGEGGREGEGEGRREGGRERMSVFKHVASTLHTAKNPNTIVVHR